MIINLSVLLFKKSNIVGKNDFENMLTLNFLIASFKITKNHRIHICFVTIPVMVVAAVVD